VLTQRENPLIKVRARTKTCLFTLALQGAICHFACQKSEFLEHEQWWITNVLEKQKLRNRS
jgi:hypothetical protein